jgi:hypothetical protein
MYSIPFGRKSLIVLIVGLFIGGVFGFTVAPGTIPSPGHALAQIQGYFSGDTSLEQSLGKLQQLVSGNCAAGSSIRVINVDGTVECETDDTGGGDTAADVRFVQGNGDSVNITLPSGTWVLEAHATFHQTVWHDASLIIDGTTVHSVPDLGDQEGTGYLVLFGAKQVSGGTRTISISKSGGHWGEIRILAIASKIS